MLVGATIGDGGSAPLATTRDYPDSNGSLAGIIPIGAIGDLTSLSFDFTDGNGTNTITLTAADIADFANSQWSDTVADPGGGWDLYEFVTTVSNAPNVFTNSTIYFKWKVINGNIVFVLDCLYSGGNGAARTGNPSDISYANVSAEFANPVVDAVGVYLVKRTAPAYANTSVAVADTMGVSGQIVGKVQSDIIEVALWGGYSFYDSSGGHQFRYFDGAHLDNNSDSYFAHSVNGGGYDQQERAGDFLGFTTMRFGTKDNGADMDIEGSSVSTFDATEDRLAGWLSMAFVYPV